MCDFTAECTDAVTLDPYKRVCYSNGLVLGVDEFLQEELYLLEKHRLHNRALHGYGTICGLSVSARDAGDAGPEIVVAPGLALDPVGHEIRVPQPQCARLDEWLLRHPEVAGSPPAVGSPADLSLYVVLCYRECKTDEVPIPGGPCRTLDDSTAPSRIADAFELALRTEPPEQFEEDAIRAFGDLLRAIEIVDSGGLGADELADLVRGLAAGSPPGFEPFLDASPPGVQVDAAVAEEAIRAAFRVWVTEVRPRILPDGRNCASGPPREECVLLARLDFPVEEGVDGSLRVAGDDTAVAIDELERPYLLQTRVLQECCIAHGAAGEGGGGPVITVHADLSGLTADDHPQYLLVDPATRALVADLDADGIGGPFIVSGMREATANGEAVRFEQAVKVGDTAGAPGQDVRGTYPDVLRVVGLQERPVSNAAPDSDDVLTWSGTRWEPRPLPAPGGGGEADLTRVVALNWVHGERATDPFPEITLDGRRLRAVAVAFGFREVNDGGRARVERGSLDDMSFQLFSEETFSPGLHRDFRITGDVVPLDEIGLAGSLIDSAVTAAGPLAAGAALVFDDDVVGDGDVLDRALALTNRNFLVLLRGDVVVDEAGRAIDAEHLRAELATGDRPAGAELGIQGGRFESWFRLRGRVDVNFATLDELTALPGVGPTLARRIIEARPFTSVNGLREVNGIGQNLFNQIRDLVTV